MTGQIDWGRLELPSDGITVGNIRRQQSDLFDPPHRVVSIPLERVLAFDILSNEMDLARRAFEHAATGKSDGELVAREELIEQLLEDYARAGIGAGEKSRQALIQKIEADASEQALERQKRR